MPSTASGPQVFVDVYPFEGGVFQFNSGISSSILDLMVSKTLLSKDPGSFAIELVPGGPGGIDATPAWQDIITPKSLVVIGLSRFTHQQIVMVGVVTSVGESTTWVPNRGVQRSLRVVGEDFQNLFICQNFYLQLYLAFTTNNALGSTGFLSSLGLGATPLSPDQIGLQWFNTVMAGQSGILSDLSFFYQGVRLTFTQLMGTFFEPYPGNIKIPVGDYYFSSEGNWMDKFSEIFPFPWYEMFVTTAPQGYYGTEQGQPTGFAIGMEAMPGAVPVSPTLVGRVNPLPFTPGSGSLPPVAPTTVDSTAWSALPTFTLDNFGYLSSAIIATEGEVRNFYVINPKAITQQFGGSNAQVVPFLYQHAAWLDAASVHRYGFKPQTSELIWMNDESGAYAQQLAAGGQGQSDIEQLVATLALKQTSYFEPVTLMRRGQVVMELRPDILPGGRFSYQPYKNSQANWLFYIDGVTHHYSFNGTSTTALNLSRGLPVDVYNNADLLLAIHTGEAMLQDGVFQRGLPPGIGTGLQPIYTGAILNGVMGNVAGIFGSAQPSGQ
jgi:hypothetical protein